MPDARPSHTPSQQRSLGIRLAWFVALWLAGVGAVALVSYGLRLWIAPA